MLGVFLGSEGFLKERWEGVKEMVCTQLSKWKCLLSQLSYRRRVLLDNNLVASTLWHRLIALTAPREDVQRPIVNFF